MIEDSSRLASPEKLGNRDVLQMTLGGGVEFVPEDVFLGTPSGRCQRGERHNH